MQKLTQKQADTFQYIKDFIAEKLYAPSMKEISDHFDIAPNAAQDRVGALVRKGALIRTKGLSRTMSPVKGFRVSIFK